MRNMGGELKQKLLEHLMDMMGGMDGERVPKSGLSAMADENADDDGQFDSESDLPDEKDDGMDPRLMIIIKAKKAGAARG